MTDATTTTTQPSEQPKAWLGDVLNSFLRDTCCLSWTQVNDISALAFDSSGVLLWVETDKDGVVGSRRVRVIELEDGEKRNVLGRVEAYCVNLDAVT